MPESFGGTERYIDELITELARYGVNGAVLAAINSESAVNYKLHGYLVHRYPTKGTAQRDAIRGMTPHQGFQEFLVLMKSQHADIYHQHSWTTGCGIHHLRAASGLGLSTVLTLHVPSPLCMTGTLMTPEGPCRRKIDSKACAACHLQNQGAPRALAKAVSRLPQCISHAALKLQGRVGSVLAMRALAQQHLDQLDEALSIANRVVVLANWQQQMLLDRGHAADKIRLIRHGITPQDILRPSPRAPGPLRVGFIGRWDSVKGVHLLASAVAAIPAQVKLELHIHGLGADEAAISYRQSVEQLAAHDARIQIRNALPPDAVAAFLASIDVLAVPSQWYETGPLVVLESFAVGTPVIGSDLGGIAEQVVTGRNGWLLPASDTAAWTDLLSRLASGPIPAPLQLPVRTMATVAQEMRSVYEELLAARRL